VGARKFGELDPRNVLVRGDVAPREGAAHHVTVEDVADAAERLDLLPRLLGARSGGAHAARFPQRRQMPRLRCPINMQMSSLAVMPPLP
jgi:hypothetical protein